MRVYILHFMQRFKPVIFYVMAFVYIANWNSNSTYARDCGKEMKRPQSPVMHHSAVDSNFQNGDIEFFSVTEQLFIYFTHHRFYVTL